MFLIVALTRVFTWQAFAESTADPAEDTPPQETPSAGSSSGASGSSEDSSESDDDEVSIPATKVTPAAVEIGGSEQCPELSGVYELTDGYDGFYEEPCPVYLRKEADKKPIFLFHWEFSSLRSIVFSIYEANLMALPV